MTNRLPNCVEWARDVRAILEEPLKELWEEVNKVRLIDADVFKTEYENLITWVSHRAEKARLREFIKDIQNQPTVKAIPIEWLNKRAEEIAFAYWTNARNKVTLPLNELPLLIDQIVGEWEKENGTE